MVKRLISNEFVRIYSRYAFITLALSQIVRGVSYLPSNRPELPRALAEMTANGIPIAIWAAFWIISGVLILISMKIRKPMHIKIGKEERHYRFADIGVIFTIGLYAAWGFTYWISYILSLMNHASNLDYAAACTFTAWGAIGFSGWLYWVQNRADA